MQNATRKFLIGATFVVYRCKTMYASQYKTNTMYCTTIPIHFSVYAQNFGDKLK